MSQLYSLSVEGLKPCVCVLTRYSNRVFWKQTETTFRLVYTCYVGLVGDVTKGRLF